ncbi:MAG: hypothetical protein K9I34_06820 [Bacteroidales bacterium]|nr:hypothetical protein [Bacteroidales bacterium]
MKKISLLLISGLLGLYSYAQCVPDETCVDTEAPGQICPDSLPDGMANGTYEQTITIIPPDSFMLNGNPLYLSHIQLSSINNVPPGLTCETNASNNLFAVGTKYCAKISGIPTTEGFFQLEIGIYPYINGFPMGILVVDDTSLSITIQPEQIAIQAQSSEDFNALFLSTLDDETLKLKLHSPIYQQLYIEIVDLQGRILYHSELEAQRGKNQFAIPANWMGKGLYVYQIKGLSGRLVGKLNRI